MTIKDYPNWVCTKCAEAANGKYPDGHISSWHNAICPCCGEHTNVTQPRDFSWPDLIERFKYEPKEPE